MGYRKVHVKLIVLTWLAGFVFLTGCLSKPKDEINVIFISLDTTRYDYVDTGRGARAYTPELRRFSEQSVVFENAFSTSNQTLPSHLSVLTSYSPSELGVQDNASIYDGRFPMIQQVFEEKGYQTAAVISLGTLSSSTGIKTGFQEFRENLAEEGQFFAPAERVTSEAAELIRGFKDDKFFLFVHYSDPHTPYAPPDTVGVFELCLDGNILTGFNAYQGAILRKGLPLSAGNHLLEFRVKSSMEDFSYFVIRNMNISEGCVVRLEGLEYSESLYGGSYVMKNQRARVHIDCGEDGRCEIFQVIPILKKSAAKNLYRREVEYLDRSLGKLLKTIEKDCPRDKTVVILFGDHGEGHGEREEFFGHTKYLNRQFIQVPLVMRLPGYKGKRIESPVSLSSVSPTVLELMGIRAKSFKHEESVLKAVRKGKAEETLVYSFAVDEGIQSSKVSIIKWPLQSIFYLEKGTFQKNEYYNFDLSQSFSGNDAIPRDIIKRTFREHYDAFQREYARLKNARYLTGSHRKKVDRKALEKLKALGYTYK